MGRTPICRRGYQHHGEGEVPNTPESPDKPAFPRRFPRLGIQFQTKIPKSNEPLERPPPESCSADYPHLTETEAKQETIEQNGMYIFYFYRF